MCWFVGKDTFALTLRKKMHINLNPTWMGIGYGREFIGLIVGN